MSKPATHKVTNPNNSNAAGPNPPVTAIQAPTGAPRWRSGRGAGPVFVYSCDFTPRER